MKGKSIPRPNRTWTDNVAKHLIDCLVRMRFMEDDKQIVALKITKQYGDEPGYHVTLEEL